MGIYFNKFLADFNVNEPASEYALTDAEAALGIQLPADYKEFLLLHDGGEGFVGKHYLVLWKAEVLFRFNQDYEVFRYAPGFVVFGSSGGGDGFAYDTRRRPYHVVQVPFIGMSLSDGFFVAENFTRLLERMLKTDGSLF